MNELERVARMICAADGRDPDAPTWTNYTCYLMAALDVINAPPAHWGLDEDWQHTCTMPPGAPPKL